MQEQANFPKKKQSLCRYYVRGLCILKKDQCFFSHGIDDIDFHLWQEGEEIEYDYLKDTDFTQKKTIKGPRTDKIYSLEQINNNRPLRAQIRNKMHKKLFIDFMNLLQREMSGANFTEDVLLRQYTRVGFNKLMTRIKFSHLTDTLCQGQNARYFMKSIIMPPLVNQTKNFIFRRAPEQEIVECYRSECQRFINDAEGKLDETALKKHLFKMTFPNYNIPPLNQFLKEKQLNFTTFLKFLDKGNVTQMMQNIRLEPSVQELTVAAGNYLSNSKDVLLTWQDVHTYLSKTFQINNGNIINQVKPFLVSQGFYFLYFPMVQLIFSKNLKYPFEADAQKLCKCSYKNIHELDDLKQLFEKERVPIGKGQVVQINNWQSLLKYGTDILNSKILGVDSEGTLRKGGSVQMIQLNNGHNTFLLDVYSIQLNKHHTTFDALKKLLRNILANPNVLKIFHDCRHDSLALHECVETCIVNIFDTSAVGTLKAQLEHYSACKENLEECKAAIAACVKVRTPGLNEILLKYKASHGTNKYKQKFHQMWKEGQGKFFLKRPLDQEYKDYCIWDVLDLPEVYSTMTLQMQELMIHIGKWISAQYVSYGYEHSYQEDIEEQKA